MNREYYLATEEECVGCAVCADVCSFESIKMERDAEGFARPIVDREKCVGCGKCRAACPVLRDAPRADILSLRAAWLNDVEKIRESTSGGAFRALAEKVLKEDGVVFGASFDGDFRLAHVRRDQWENLSSLLGSKYLQSDAAGIYRGVELAAQTGAPVLFSGTPCQCDALRGYFAAKKTEVPKNVALCETMCHGTPSPGIFADYVAWLEKKYGGKLTAYNFRYKGLFGWDIRKLSVSLAFSNGRKVARRARYDPWHSWFGLRLSIRPSCFVCRYRDVKRCADLTLGDFWSIAKIAPELDSKNGVSAIFVNSAKGARLLEGCRDALSGFDVDVAKVGELFNVPIRQGTVSVDLEARAAFFQTYRDGGVKATLKKYPPKTFLTAAIARMIWALKAFSLRFSEMRRVK